MVNASKGRGGKGGLRVTPTMISYEFEMRIVKVKSNLRLTIHGTNRDDHDPPISDTIQSPVTVTPHYHYPGTSATSVSEDLDSPDLIHGDQNPGL